MAGSESGGRQSDEARRARRVRIHVARDNQAEFARLLDITPQRWANFEGGLPLSKEVAIKMVQKIPGLTLDYLYLGKTDGMPVHLSLQLEAISEDQLNRKRKARA